MLNNLSDILPGFYKNEKGELAQIDHFHGGFKARYSTNREDQILSNNLLRQENFSRVSLENYEPTPTEQTFIKKTRQKQKAEDSKKEPYHFTITAPLVFR